MKTVIRIATMLIAQSAGLLLAAETELPAFPGAEGFGANARGGRGGTVLFVTNLNDSGNGSLRSAVGTKGPRTIVFQLSGTIELKSRLNVSDPFVTIAGQSAPGDGICLKNFGILVQTHDVVVRHLRIRPGDEPAKEFAKRGKDFTPDAISIAAPSRDVIFDHCSASWSVDECCSVSGEGITNVTVQWCLISESLNDSVHPKGEHGYGSLLRCNGDVSFHHNIYAHHKSRSPRPGTYGDGSILLDFRNNVIYDTKGYSAADPVRMNYVGNYIRRTGASAFQVGGPTTKLFVSDNVLQGDSRATSDNWRLISGKKTDSRMPIPYAVAKVKTQSAEDAYKRILTDCGATRPKRDAVDARIIDQIRNGTGKLINSQKQVGGWPPLKSTSPPSDKDHDGLPDTWERDHGLNPSKASDQSEDADGNGYTNLEEFLNSRSSHRARTEG
jgi:pectate lyase